MSDCFKKIEPIAAVLAYATSAIAIIIFNKAVLSTYGFRAPLFMTWVHMLVTCGCTAFLKLLGIVTYPDLNWRTVRNRLMLSGAFVGNIVFGLLSTKAVSVPVMTTLRRCSALFIIMLEYMVNNQIPKFRVSILPISIMLIGAFMTGAGDFYFDFFGYFIVFVNDFLTASYLILLKKSGDDLGKWGTLFYNSFLSSIFLTMPMLFDLPKLQEFEFIHDTFFLICFSGSAMLAFAVNLTVVWCTQATSPLTTSVTGQTKNIFTTIAGMLLFNDYKSAALANTGIVVSMCGSFLYAYEKFQEKSEKDKLSTLNAHNDEEEPLTSQMSD